MKLIRHLFLLSSFLTFLLCQAQTFPTAQSESLQRKLSAGVTQYDLLKGTFNIASGDTVTFKSGSTLALSGMFSGTPTGGTLDLSALTLTLPSSFLTAAQIAAAYQPLDSDLTAIAALSTTPTGRSLLSVTTLSATGLGLTNGAALDALAAVSSTGLLARTGSNTYAARTLTGTLNEITVTNGDGVSGSPTLSLPSALTFTGKTVTGGTFNSGAFNGTLGATTPSTIAATTISASGQITSTVTTGTAPFVVASTTAVSNLNASLLLGSTWASPAAIGTGTPAAGTFTTLTASGVGLFQSGDLGVTAAGLTFLRLNDTTGKQYLLESGRVANTFTIRNSTDATQLFSLSSVGVATFAATTSGTSTTLAAILGKSMGLTENLYVGGYIANTVPTTPMRFYNAAGNNWTTVANNTTDGTSNSGLTIGTGGLANAFILAHSGAATFGSTITVSGTGTSSFAGPVTVAKSGAPTIVTIGDGLAGSEAHLVLRGNASQTAWQVGSNVTLSNGYEIAASTVAGGTTFSTPVFTMTTSILAFAGTGTSTFAGNLTVSGGVITATSATEADVHVTKTGTNASDVYFANSGAGSLGFSLYDGTNSRTVAGYNATANNWRILTSTVSIDGVTTLSSATASTSTSTGALVLSGSNAGIGMPGDLNVGGTVYSNTFNVVSGSTATFNFGRPIIISSGQVAIKASTGGWNTGYLFQGSAGTALGGYFANGTSDSFTKFFIGDGSATAWISFTSTAVTAVGQYITSATSFTGGRAFQATAASGNTVGLRLVQTSVADWLISNVATTGALSFDPGSNAMTLSTSGALTVGNSITMSSGTLTLTGYGSGSGAVSVGAADSGGSGFKVLRVPN